MFFILHHFLELLILLHVELARNCPFKQVDRRVVFRVGPYLCVFGLVLRCALLTLKCVLNQSIFSVLSFWWVVLQLLCLGSVAQQLVFGLRNVFRRRDSHWLLQRLIILSAFLNELSCKIRAKYFNLVHRKVKEEVAHHTHYETFQLLNILYLVDPILTIIEYLSFYHHLWHLILCQGRLDLLETVFENVDEFLLTIITFRE